MLKNKTTKNSQETKAFAKKMLGELLKLNMNKRSSLVLCLEGNLGGGKTTFVQGLAEGLGIKEVVSSPTFLIMKKYTAPDRKRTNACLLSKKYNLYHFDCYRISNYQEILDLGFEDIISGKNNIIAIEWPEKIKKILPKERINIKFDFVDEKTRKIKY